MVRLVTHITTCVIRPCIQVPVLHSCKYIQGLLFINIQIIRGHTQRVSLSSLEIEAPSREGNHIIQEKPILIQTSLGTQ